jgi:hypothetical protein
MVVERILKKDACDQVKMFDWGDNAGGTLKGGTSRVATGTQPGSLEAGKIMGLFTANGRSFPQ